MKTALLRLCITVVFLLLVIGCNGDGDNENPNALTVTNLQGTYDLNTNAMPGDLVGDDDLIATSGMLEITADTLTFTLMLEGMGPFTLAGTTVTITDSDGNTEDVQVTLSDGGNTLTVVTDDGVTFVLTRRDGMGRSDDLTVANLQGIYDVDVSRSTAEDLVSAELEVAGDILTFMGTNSQTGSHALAGGTVTVTFTDGSVDMFQATLSNGGNTLTLVNEDGNAAVFERR